jgi:hypothetical protein
MKEENLTLKGGKTPSKGGKFEEGWERKQMSSK